MVSTENIIMQFGAKPLLGSVLVKFGEGNQSDLIGTNGEDRMLEAKFEFGEPTDIFDIYSIR